MWKPPAVTMEDRQVFINRSTKLKELTVKEVEFLFLISEREITLKSWWSSRKKTNGLCYLVVRLFRISDTPMNFDDKKRRTKAEKVSRIYYDKIF